MGRTGTTILALALSLATAARAAEPAPTESAEHAGLDSIALDRSLAPVQSEPAPAPAAEGPMAEIVVTAQKREERAQDVPISIQAYAGEDLAVRGIDSTRQLDQLVPSLQFAAIAAFPLVFIRGLGTDNFVPSADPSIATYIDGIYVPNGAGAVQSLSQVARVEVLKGPQGALFGRNATGGAINVVTADPGREWTGSVELEAARFDARSVEAAVSGPLGDSFALSLSGQTQRSDPYYSALSYDVPEQQLDAVRAKLVATPREHLQLALAGYYAEQAGQFQMIYQNVQPSLLGTALGIQAERDDFVGEVDLPGIAQGRQRIVSATADWQRSGADLRLLASDQQHEAKGQIDFDGSSVPSAGLSTDNAFIDLQTVELQLLSNANSWAAEHLSWVAGLYALCSSAGFDPVVVRNAPGLVSGVLAQPGDPVLGAFGAQLEDIFNAFGLSQTPLGDGGVSLVGRGVLDTRSYSAYVNATAFLGERFEFTLGGRAQHERRFLTQAQTELADFSGEGSTTVLPFELQSARETNFAPRVVLAYKPTPRAMLYASYAVAYKSGTYNVVNTYVPPNYLQPEKVDSIELGTKLDALDGALRVDAALFHSRIRDLQSGFTSLLSGGIVQFFSVPRARTRGAEANLSWVPMPVRNPGLSLSLNGAYIDAIYQEFPDGPGFDPVTGLYAGDYDHSGNRLTYTPRWSGNAAMLQTLCVASGHWDLGVQVSSTAKIYANAQNAQTHGSYNLLGA